MAERSRQGVGVAVLCVTGSWSGPSYKVIATVPRCFFLSTLGMEVVKFSKMKKLIFALTLLLGLTNFSYAAVSYSDLKNEEIQASLSFPKKQFKKEKKIMVVPPSYNKVLLGYYITYPGVLFAVISISVAAINPLVASLFLILGLLFALIGLLIMGFSLDKLKKDLNN